MIREVSVSIPDMDHIATCKPMFGKHGHKSFIEQPIIRTARRKQFIQFRLALGIEPGILPGCTRRAFRVIDGLYMEPALGQY